jgi:hypothetical protein
LVYSTFLSGSESLSRGDAIVVDPQGFAYVAGETGSSDFPTTPGAFDTVLDGEGEDAFISKLNQTGTALIYSTFLGGGNYDEVSGIALDRRGAAYVVGSTDSPDFPVTLEAYDQTLNDAGDVFIAKLNPNGSALRYATYLGVTIGILVPISPWTVSVQHILSGAQPQWISPAHQGFRQ